MRRAVTRWLKATTRVGLLALALLALRPDAAQAHLGLRSSTPANGDTVRTRITELRLAYTEDLALDVVRLRLRDATGREILLGGLRHVQGSLREFAVHAGPELWDGAYTLEWRVVGSDGHPVTGEIRFVVLGVQAPVDPRADTAALEAARTTQVPPMDASERILQAPLSVAIRGLYFTALIAAVGALAFALLVVPAAASRASNDPVRLSPEHAEALRSRVALVGIVATILLAFTADQRIDIQANAIFQALGGTSESPREFLETLDGAVWLRALIWQAGAALVALAGFVLARRQRRWGWWLAAATVPVLVVAPAFAGHAFGTEPRAVALILDALHVLAAATWLGALTCFFVVAIPALQREPRWIGASQLAALAEAFTPMALAAAAVLGVTGVAGAWMRVGSDQANWMGPYGQVLTLKMAALAIVLAAGFYNWRRVRPRLGDEAGTRALVWSSSVELLGGALVVIATAVLVATPLPH